MRSRGRTLYTLLLSEARRSPLRPAPLTPFSTHSPQFAPLSNAIKHVCQRQIRDLVQRAPNICSPPPRHFNPRHPNTQSQREGHWPQNYLTDQGECRRTWFRVTRTPTDETSSTKFCCSAPHSVTDGQHAEPVRAGQNCRTRRCQIPLTLH